MNKRVLFVDDEPHVLEAIRRNMRKLVEVHTAEGPERGLELLKAAPTPFAVIVADMRMPVMDGVEFLRHAKNIAPDTVRLMLTGNADQQTAVRAVNTGEVFRFLNKPCEPELLEQNLGLALRQYELVTAEKELLNKTLKGSIEAMVEIMALSNPLAFGRVKRIRSMCRQVLKQLGREAKWELEAAALLSQLGCVSLPKSLLEKVTRGVSLNAREAEEFMSHPQKARDLISRIPRLENVAAIVEYQFRNFDGSGLPRDTLSGTDIPFGARLLRVVLEYDELKIAGASDTRACEQLRKRAEFFDPELLEALCDSVDGQEDETLASLPTAELRDGMVLAEDIVNDKGVLLACRGLEVNSLIREHLLNFAGSEMVQRRILVRLPAGMTVQSLEEKTACGRAQAG